YEALRDNWIRSLLVSRDGTLWIGALRGLASWKDGKLTQDPQLGGLAVDAILQDRDGSVWVSGGALPSGKLCVIGLDVRCYGEDGRFGAGGRTLFEDR